MLSFGALAITAAAVAGDTITVSVFPTKDGFSVKQGIDKSAAAQVIFEDTLLKTGWGKLDIKTNKEFSDELQMKSAGVGEGYVTASHIATLYANMLPITFQSGGPSKEVTRFLDTQEAWTKVVLCMRSPSLPARLLSLYLSHARRSSLFLRLLRLVFCRTYLSFVSIICRALPPFHTHRNRLRPMLATTIGEWWVGL